MEEKIYKVVVDYSKSLSEIIKEGQYEWFNDEINDKNFSLKSDGQHEVELVLVHLNRDATTKEVLEHLDTKGLVAARLEHLLAFWARYSNFMTGTPIFALGSKINIMGECDCPMVEICSSSSERWFQLKLIWCGEGRIWDKGLLFLALHKK